MLPTTGHAPQSRKYPPDRRKFSKVASRLGVYAGFEGKPRAGVTGHQEETMSLRVTAQALGALVVGAAIVVCALYVTKSTAQSAKQVQPEAGSNASPIYGVTIPAGYRDWSVISVGHLTDTGGKVKQLRAQLGNDIAMKAFREGKLPFPDGAIIAALHWTEV